LRPSRPADRGPMSPRVVRLADPILTIRVAAHL
jgi:hypothetical protein